jgi:hypothetical protein
MFLGTNRMAHLAHGSQRIVECNIKYLSPELQIWHHLVSMKAVKDKHDLTRP